MTAQKSFVDMHVHTKYSRTAGNWILNQLKINECYTEPKNVYKIAKSRGMNFVTITDHDIIDGALEVAHMPNFFVSEEISAYFPGDKAKVHVLAYNISEQHHAEIQKLRYNIYELVLYLNQQEIVNAIAHPYYKMGPPLTMNHIEQMLLLFTIFEVKNGGKQLEPDNLLESILDNLTAEKIWQLAEKHNIDPVGFMPWVKSKIAGSDDHGGILIASPHTVTEKANSVEELLGKIKKGQCSANGHGGTPLSVAHGSMAVGFNYARQNKNNFSHINNELTWLMLENIFDETAKNGLFSLSLAFTKSRVKKTFSNRKKNLSSKMTKQILGHITSNQEIKNFLKGDGQFNHENNIKFFTSINNIVNSYFAALYSLSKQKNTIFEGLENIILLKNILPLIVPYFVAFKTEHKDRNLMRQSAQELLPAECQPPKKVAVFSDNNLATLLVKDEIYDLLAEETASGFEAVYFTLGDNYSPENYCYTYAPVANIMENPKYDLPPLLHVSYDFSQQSCHLIYLDTLGPMALLGLLLGKLLDIPLLSTFHKTEIEALAQKTAGKNSIYFSAIVSWVYSQLDEIRLLDIPSSFEYTYLEKVKNKIRILGNEIFFEQAELPIVPELDIF